MNKHFKPSGYNSVSPYFIVDDADQFIELMKQIFNATLLRRYDEPGGKIMHAELKIDDSVIMLGSSSEKFPSIFIVMHVYVANVEEVFNKAIQVGCEEIQPPKVSEGDPDKRATFKDIFGNTWSVGTQL
ncbi:MAG: VOC family protein [Saprospiraceae bacterium]